MLLDLIFKVFGSVLAPFDIQKIKNICKIFVVAFLYKQASKLLGGGGDRPWASSI